TWLRARAVDQAAATRVLGAPPQRDAHLLDLLRRPQIAHRDLLQLAPNDSRAAAADDIMRQVQIEARYSGYIDRQRAEIARRAQAHETEVPTETDYGAVRGLSAEARQNLSQVKPQTIGQAARVPGVTPAAISLLLVHLKKSRRAA
ncbi:MAG: tRNA uridine-5-carboxymethylaminomethyl(34) synthesis enzyme MnmG, partial [bacterium]